MWSIALLTSGTMHWVTNVTIPMVTCIASSISIPFSNEKWHLTYFFFENTSLMSMSLQFRICKCIYLTKDVSMSKMCSKSFVGGFSVPRLEWFSRMCYNFMIWNFRKWNKILEYWVIPKMCSNLLNGMCSYSNESIEESFTGKACVALFIFLIMVIILYNLRFQRFYIQ